MRIVRGWGDGGRIEYGFLEEHAYQRPVGVAESQECHAHFVEPVHFIFFISRFYFRLMADEAKNDRGEATMITMVALTAKGEERWGGSGCEGNKTCMRFIRTRRRMHGTIVDTTGTENLTDNETMDSHARPRKTTRQ